MTSRPGTVSKILWHFTGGPKWCSKSNKQLEELKPATQGYNALKEILTSKELRVGNYQKKSLNFKKVAKWRVYEVN